VSNTPFVPFYTSDFLSGTGGMTAATKGVYITILCLIYEAETPLPQSWETLARRCGCTLPAFKKAVEALIDDGKVTLIDGAIWSPKCEKHLALRRERQSSARSAAKTRWQKSEQNQSEDDAGASFPQCQPEPEPEPEEKEAAAAVTREAIPGSELDQLHGDLLSAVGLNNGRLPTHWLPPAATMHIGRWVNDLGLTPTEIIATASASRQQHSEAPQGPRALDRAMQALAATKAAPVMQQIKPTHPAPRPTRLWNLNPDEFNDDGSLRQ
jgi:uncharacterized protein YdaU (DUF1376 family)